MMTSTHTDAQSAVTQKMTSQPVALLLKTYLRQFFNDDYLQFCAHTGLPRIKVRRWLASDAIVFGQGIYLQASKCDEFTAETEQRHQTLLSGTVDVQHLDSIVNKHGMTQDEFANAHGLSQQQVSRWVKRNCIFVTKQVYRMQMSLEIPHSSSASRSVSL